MTVVVIVVVVGGGAISSAPPPRRRPCRQPQRRQVDDAVAATYPTPAIAVRTRVRRTPFAFRATMSIRARVRAMPGAVFPRPYIASTTDVGEAVVAVAVACLTLAAPPAAMICLHATTTTIATAAALYRRTWPISRQ